MANMLQIMSLGEVSQFIAHVPRDTVPSWAQLALKTDEFEIRDVDMDSDDDDGGDLEALTRGSNSRVVSRV